MVATSMVGEVPDVAYRIAGVWLVREDQVLLLRRRGRSRGAWVPPGGLVEDGEEPIEAAYRETVEETGIAPNRLEWLHEFTWHAAQPRQVFQFIGEAGAGQVVLSDEHSAARWLRPADYLTNHLAESRPGLPEDIVEWIQQMRLAAVYAARWIEERRTASNG